MKRILICLTAIAMATFSAQGQENKDVQKTTTVKKVTQKDTNVKTKIVRHTDTDKEVLEVEGTNKQDQKARVIKQKSGDTQLVGDRNTVDERNQQQILALKQKREAELQASIAKRKEEAAAKAKQEREAKKAEKERELEQRKAELTHRPKGMAKYSKD